VAYGMTKSAVSIEVSREIDGLEMGVLSNGTPFLSARGLANICGVARNTIGLHTRAWEDGRRDAKFLQFLVRNGVATKSLCLRTEVSGNVIYAYPDEICTLFLEYYSFEAPNPTAQASYRTVARAGLKLFIYTALGYDPTRLVPPGWRHFLDRVSLISAPPNYFSVFKETAEFVVNAIRAGLAVDEHTVPDISVGKLWSAYWESQNLESKYGQRIRHPHHYPPYFPQSASNPQPIWVYPIMALGEFRIWLQRDYVPGQFPRYLENKVRAGLLPASTAEILAIQASPKERVR